MPIAGFTSLRYSILGYFPIGEKPRSLWLVHWEPGELRSSRRVLREAGGAIPPAYSPIQLQTKSSPKVSWSYSSVAYKCSAHAFLVFKTYLKCYCFDRNVRGFQYEFCSLQAQYFHGFRGGVTDMLGIGAREISRTHIHSFG